MWLLISTPYHTGRLLVFLAKVYTWFPASDASLIITLRRVAPPTTMDAPGQVRQSCDRCYCKKVKCEVSGTASKCNRCTKRGTECVFSPPGRNGRPPRASTTNDQAGQAAPAAPCPSITPKPAQGPETRPVLPASPPPSTNNDPQPPPAQSHELSVNSFDAEFGLFTESELYSQPGSLDFGQDAFSSTNDDDLLQILQTPISPIDTLDNQEVQQQPSAEETVLFGDFPYPIAPTTDPFQQLQSIQRKLLDYSNDASPRQGQQIPSTFDAGSLFQLIEELHDVIQRYLDVDARGESSLDFNTAMVLTTTIGNAVKIYEMLADCTTSVSEQEGPGGSKRQRTFSETSSAGRRSVDTPWISTASSSSSSSSSYGSPNYTMPQIRINAFVTSPSFGQLVLAQHLLGQLQDMRGLIEQLQQRLIQRERNTDGQMHSTSYLSMSSGGGRFLMPEMNVTIIQLLNQMQMRISRLEPVAMDVLAQNRRRSSLVKSAQ